MKLLVNITDIATKQFTNHNIKAGVSLNTQETALDLYEQFLTLLEEKDLLPELSERNHYAGYELFFKYDNENLVIASIGATRLRYFDTNDLIDRMKSDFLLAGLISFHSLHNHSDTVNIKQVLLTMDICPYTSYDFNNHCYKEGKQIVLTFSKN